MVNVVVISSHKSSWMGGVEWTFIALCTIMVLCFVFFIWLMLFCIFTTWKPSKLQKIAIDTNSAEVFAIWR